MGQNSFTMDAASILRVATDASETSSGAEALQLDFGNTPSGPAVEQVAYTAGTLVVDVDVLDGTTGDESYDIVVQLSDDVDFSAGNVVTRAVLHLGLALGADGDDQYGLGQITLGIDNEHNGTLFRFMRLANVVAGTTPILRYGAFLAQNKNP